MQVNACVNSNMLILNRLLLLGAEKGSWTSPIPLPHGSSLLSDLFPNPYLWIWGEYVGRIYLSINATPQYVVREIINHDGAE